MSNNRNEVALYCQGTFSTANPTTAQQKAMLQNAAEISSSGFGTVILGQWHVHSNGDIYYNDTLLADVSWALSNIPSALKAGGSVQKVLITFGPFGSDFGGIQSNLASFKQQMAAVLALPDIDGLDWDLEEDYSSYTNLLEDLTSWTTGQKKIVTAAPFEQNSFWTALLANTNGNGQQGFSWWNLQLYSGITSYAPWVGYLKGLVPSPAGFLSAGYKPADGYSPSAIQTDISNLQSQFPALCGGFIWRYEDIIGQAGAYATAIINGLGL